MGKMQTIEAWELKEGAVWPLGSTWVESAQAYNFALYSKNSTGVRLLFYRREDPSKAVFGFRFDPRKNRSEHIWHCMIPFSKLAGAELYAYQIEGPWDPERGHRFDAGKLLLDPFAEEIFFPPRYDRMAAVGPGMTVGRSPLGVLPRRADDFPWGEDRRPRHTHDTIIYELHVKGFTARANSGIAPERRGTFLGLIDKIPYLKDLGVTVVELLPVHQFDPQEGAYWGYMTLNFFSPHRQYAYGNPRDEFRQMVKAFHDAGIEVWMDVVYNHTSEGNEKGPTHSFRGIDNAEYYFLDPETKAYVDNTGCGNTMRCTSPAVRLLVLESLRRWADEMRIDGFRFDLASIFARHDDGSLNTVSPPIIFEISYLAYQSDLRLVAEAWDIEANLLGKQFPGLVWRQWNGKYRDDIRMFVKGDKGVVGALAQRLYGSDDLFPEEVANAYRPYQSINYVTSHDGFCLYDLTAYNQKHNQANGNDNQDGSDWNFSWNCGIEGDQNVPQEVAALRRRQAKNFFALLMLSNGTPMFCAGDEFLNTQKGNNNPYNQDNETTWLDWDLLEKNRPIFRFFKNMIAFRKAHRSIGRSGYWRDDVRWYGTGPDPDFGEESHALAYCLLGKDLGDSDLYVMINGDWKDHIFTLQEGTTKDWKRVIDTSLESPEDVLDPGHEAALRGPDYLVKARSIVVLIRPLS